MQRDTPSWWVGLIAVLVIGGCASLAMSEYPGQSTATISNQEIEEAGLMTLNVYDLVQRLRPRWLQTGPSRSLGLGTRIVVYLDDRRMGGPDELRLISAAEIREVLYLDAAQAARLAGAGSDHIEAAIVVVMSGWE